NELGNMYISGKDVLRDEKQAIHWLQQAEKINESTNEADVECE
ncbi:thymidine phosphorylase, partial [Candidatus Endoriftia persephone str. Guaymas]|nr:thymidine phosphorylase [Candidatus Endoriftia persephone str. Guaymas]